MIKEAIYDVINGKNLDLATAKQAMCEIMEGNATNAQIGGFLTALRLKGETIDEITAFAQAMREKCSVVKHDRDVFEIVGTGGDEANTFNISTTAGFVIASAGVQVAKHGNRSVSSKCGAADSGSVGNEPRFKRSAECQNAKPDRHVLHVCTALSRFHEIRRTRKT